MSNFYRLERLTFNNFKLFGKEFKINFSSNDLIVFDGPNGHGKTTVYDATELALTGGIRRLNSTENQQNPTDVVVAHNNNMDCFVRLELKSANNSIVIERRIKNNIPNSAKKISNFENLWELILISDDEPTVINQTKLNELLGSPNLARDFTLFHYVEQEDTAHFLKHKKEKERAEALSVLFGDTIEMQKRVAKVEKIEKRLGDILKEKEREKEILENRGNLEITETTEASDVTFIPLLQWSTSNFEWDREIIETFSPEKRDSFFLELHNINSLIKNSEFFLNKRERTLVTSQNSVLRAFIASSQYLDKLDVLKEQLNSVNLIGNIQKLLNVNSLKALLNTPTLNKAFLLVGYESGDEFLSALKDIVDGKERNTKSSKFVLELLGYRSQLQAHLITQKDEKDCILCGSTFDDHNQLIYSITQKELALKSLLSDDEQRLENLQSLFVKNMLTTFFDKVVHFLSNTLPPSSNLILQLEEANKIHNRMTNLEKWLIKKEISYSDLLLSYDPVNNTDAKIESKLSVLKDRILQKVKQSPEDYEKLNDEINFENVFKIYFDAKSAHLKTIGSSDVQQKILYLQKLFFESISSDIKAYKLVKANIDKLSIKKFAIYELRKNLKASISRYQKLLIKDIEIPFYIYSGKVLQAHQSGIGNGIFIKDKTGGDELKNIRFVSNWQSDHDVINTMSSGQIAAVVTTLYLALNKVYSKGFGTLLIDDPVQTMDEINMISLVELLRNEFSDRQIILSTHEDHVSRYFIYKFLKYNRKVRQVKLLEKKEYQLSN